MSQRANAFNVGALTCAAFLSAAASAYAAEVVVDQHDLKFVPNAVTIVVGDSIRFTDSDHITHNITIVSPQGVADDKGMDRYGQDITVSFANPGSYKVHCRIHPMMEMTVTVNARH